MGFLRNVHQPGLKTFEVTLGIVDPTILPADKAFVTDVDVSPLDAGVGIIIVDQSPTEPRAVAGAAVDEAEVETVLRVFTPNVQRDAADFSGLRIDGDVRCQRSLEEV